MTDTPVQPSNIILPGVVNPFTDVPYVGMPISQPVQGGAFTNVSELQAGFGSKVFRADRSGIWLGGERFEDAPFSVDMLGNLIASQITINNSSGQAIIDSNGIVSTTNFTSVSVVGAGTDTGLTNDTYADISGLSITFSLSRQARVLVLGGMEAVNGHQYDDLSAGYAFAKLVLDGADLSNVVYFSSPIIAYTAVTTITGSELANVALISTMSAGSHTIKWQAATSNTSYDYSVFKDRSFIVAVVLGT